ncbi:Calcium release-activated calcium channel protein, partial [Globisporangium splendens]
MAAVGAVVEAVFGSYDLKNAKQWRDEDLAHREQEKQWREDAILRELTWRNADLERERRVLKLESEKRIIDARSKQLTAVGQLSALLVAFSMVSMIEVHFPDDLNHALLVAYGATCCLVVSNSFSVRVVNGASLFLLEVTLIGWVVFGRSVTTSVTMTALCAIGIIYYQMRVASRWRYLVDFLDPSSATHSDEEPK